MKRKARKEGEVSMMTRTWGLDFWDAFLVVLVLVVNKERME